MANVYLLRGDLNWDLANFPAIPGADTQPSLDVPNRDGLLEKAAASYGQVLDSTLGANLDDVFYARTGLAAIAENQAQWDKAKLQYQAIIDASNMTAGYKAYAKERIERLPEIQSTVLLVPPPAVAATTGAGYFSSDCSIWATCSQYVTSNFACSGLDTTCQDSTLSRTQLQLLPIQFFSLYFSGGA